MAIVTPPLLKALNTQFQSNFTQAFSEGMTYFEKLAMIVPSSTASNTYGWMGQFPGFREWVGDRVYNNMKAHGYSIANKTWESSVEIGRDEIEDDNLGIYTPMMSEMGRAAKCQPDELLFPMIAAGTSTVCYDGQYFFDTDHPVYPNVDGTGTAETASNFTAGAGEAWYLIDDTRSIKPFIFQKRREAALQARTALTDEVVFTSNKFRWGADARNNVGFGLWQLAHCSKAALTAENFNAAFTEMSLLKADGGRPLGIRPSLLVVGPGNRSKALEVIKAERNANGATNTNLNAVEILVVPYL